MTDEQIQAKLDQLATLCNDLHAEAQRRYGIESHIFYEADGAFHLMRRDTHVHRDERQSFIVFSSRPYCRLEAGTW